MRISFIATGVGLLVLAVNFMLIHYILKITQPQTKDVIKKILIMSRNVMLLGILILIVQIPVRLFGGGTEADIITGAGSSIILTGGYTAARATGHGNEQTVFWGGWISAIVGAIFIIISLFL